MAQTAELQRPAGEVTVLSPGQSLDTTAKSGRPQSKSSAAAQAGSPTFPPPKTDKPRPHVCLTCTRSFARLEHLKRHERSHTKEKPFACNECARCFARRDLLLRHQQKLHAAEPPSATRARRRESASSTAGSGSAKVRKNSTVAGAGGAGTGSMRPRANTISHVDGAASGMMAAKAELARQTTGTNATRGPKGSSGVGDSYRFHGMSTASGNHGNTHGLSRLETNNRHLDITAGLQTAPAHGSFGPMHSASVPFVPGTTINPAQLHFSGPPHAYSYDDATSPFTHGFLGFPNGGPAIDNETNFPWMSDFEQQMCFDENVLEASSPSIGDSGSPETMSEMLFDNMSNPSVQSTWPHTGLASGPFGYGIAPDFSISDMYGITSMSPKTPNRPGPNAESYIDTSPSLHSTSSLNGFPVQAFLHQGLVIKPDTPSNSAASIASSNRNSTATYGAIESITEAIRQALMSSLSDPNNGSGFLKTNQPQVSSPLSPENHANSRSQSLPSQYLPSTYDLQRYVAAYIQYFHPHIPFLHVASLSFDSPAFTNNLRSSHGHGTYGMSIITGGGGALILAMAAIGALYEYDFQVSRDLFEKAKTMIQLYLQERQMASQPALLHHAEDASSQNTPLWLVQAMLLNVIYGHNCGDKQAASIAHTHSAALISLARSAGLLAPTTNVARSDDNGSQADVQMSGDDVGGWNGYIAHSSLDLENDWLTWKTAEERKRTLYAIFNMSSLLVSAYNCAPALMNSEINLDLPCDESIWSAESAEIWRALGGLRNSDGHSIPFASALSSLLTASQRPQQRSHSSGGIMSENDLRPSTFGCLILINAIHNYIWETRQRHMGRQWTPQETEAMHGHIEPALRAWQAAWSSNSDHSLERPNPFGATSLSADCIPLLDLAYVRLFVNLGRSKEAFYLREFDQMAEELAHGTEIVQHSEHSLGTPRLGSTGTMSVISETPEVAKNELAHDDIANQQTNQLTECEANCTERERHLRKAAFCAANSLKMSDQLNVTFADFNSRELPLQSALCAFDCAQILAEWVSTVQQRVGKYLGVLGKDIVDFSQAPARMFLEEDDCKLLDKIRDILVHSRSKLSRSVNPETLAAMAAQDGALMEACGYGSKILLVHAQMFEKEVTWMTCREMALALRTQATHINEQTALTLSQPM